jgi:hypothetical protein
MTLLIFNLKKTKRQKLYINYNNLKETQMGKKKLPESEEQFQLPST